MNYKGNIVISEDDFKTQIIEITFILINDFVEMKTFPDELGGKFSLVKFLGWEIKIEESTN